MTISIDERPTLDDTEQALLFTEARTHKFFAERAVSEATRIRVAASFKGFFALAVNGRFNEPHRSIETA